VRISDWSSDVCSSDLLAAREGLRMEVAMKALVYHGPGQKSLDERPKPDLQAPTDAIVRVTKTTICGTDLHILKGDVTTCEPGRILGHEGVGIVEKVGTAVGSFKAGDRKSTRLNSSH